ncbi:hypothetical protein SAMD00019534_034900 [Acytostelium subglobosum LB1]|uniref:hypothetical protein n=1 Tax=Acytostelium subglobosum LB1 TaxID=1410327 RepID=UPI000644F9B1|nr:hypothetical protein SAMD00019534_034900 [Acytostelium subglobosum LB1]GAM20315.1 hypothetical protein SAMD00019534_034900 [Acytostelium subglobosum LB1]|eukprot:XP_012759836.1 hypothetical protein SAMD00019534_034900 [Acytostelium subglobosum LB1]
MNNTSTTTTTTTTKHSNSNNNTYESDSDNESEQNDYTGFQLIPDNDIGLQSDVESDDDDSRVVDPAAAKRQREEEIRRQIELNNQFLNEEFTDFTTHSSEFHSGSGDTIQDGTDSGGLDDLRVNSNNILFKDDPLFTSDASDPFTQYENQQPDNNNNNNIDNKDKPIEFCERNEKGHMVLSRDKMFPPDHVDLIKECMKDIKIDYKPIWATLLPEDKWLAGLKNKMEGKPTQSQS